uniref:ABC transporter domain-containing protein n=1 Tax=Mucochytrium quahogii TaxID=96639 RepID=A0A7S2RQ72_9STRA|mmetsp:Transcript_16214/g.26439  ORF Transcript_16214/g.26439 Transcript_16214/m.26439 type:complete len:287 (+) Transcript_16214:23-883(+)
MSQAAIEVKHLNFSYSNPYGGPVEALDDVSFTLEAGSRCLLIGANGAGKSTLLRILAGKHLHEKEQVQVLGQPAFYQTLGLSGISFLGGGWTRSMAFVGNNVAYQADIPVKEMMTHLQEEFPERREELYRILEIDPEWRMHQVSDGQRRRVQIMLGLLRPFKLLLLDEMTVDLDILARKDLLNYLKDQCQQRGATIIYATHIIDGLDELQWPTDLLFLEAGRMVKFTKYQAIKPESLYQHIQAFLTEMKAQRPKPTPKKKTNADQFKGFAHNGFKPGRMNGFLGSK